MSLVSAWRNHTNLKRLGYYTKQHNPHHFSLFKTKKQKPKERSTLDWIAQFDADHLAKNYLERFDRLYLNVVRGIIRLESFDLDRLNPYLRKNDL